MKAQSIIIRDYAGNDITNTTFVHTGTPGLQEVSPTVEMAPSISGDRAIALRRYEKKACPGTENYFCWTLCFGAVEAGQKKVWTDREIIIPEDSTFKEFHAYYDAKGKNTDAEYLYVLYDTSNVIDTSWVLIKFDYGQPACAPDSGTVGLDDLESISMHLFPNPANDFFVVSNTSSNDVVRITDVLGKEVYFNNHSTALHSLSKIQKGLYFVSVLRDDKIVFSERLIVK